MAKIMIVEDDTSLREIYSIRLTAEGYTVVMAGDGEEALAMTVREKPDLILSDVMMPKISGFDMLDILRATPELKDIKIIMMTALSSEDQRARGENLGADRYLVKSQVGIEDVVNAIHEVLGDKGQTAAPVTASATTAPAPEMATPVAPEVQPVVQQPVVSQSVAQPMPQPVAQPMPQPVAQPMPQPVAQPMPQPVAQLMPQPAQINPIEVTNAGQPVPPVNPAQ